MRFRLDRAILFVTSRSTKALGTQGAEAKLSNQKRRDQAAEKLADATPTVTPESRVQPTISPDSVPTEPPPSTISLEELVAEIEAAREGRGK